MGVRGSCYDTPFHCKKKVEGLHIFSISFVFFFYSILLKQTTQVQWMLCRLCGFINFVHPIYIFTYAFSPIWAIVLHYTSTNAHVPTNCEFILFLYNKNVQWVGLSKLSFTAPIRLETTIATQFFCLFFFFFFFPSFYEKL